MAPDAQVASPPRLGEPRPRRRAPWLIAAVAAVAIVAAAVAASPFWAPPVMRRLPWGQPAPTAKPAAPTPPAQAAAAPAPDPAPDPAIASIRTQEAQNAAAVQQLGQRLAALEAKPAPAPPPDLAPLQQQLAALSKANADLVASVAALQKAAQSQPAADPRNTALALVLLQIREAVDIARPFADEYQALLALAGGRPEIVAAAQPLGGAATGGVASRAALAQRLRELAPKIATAKLPPGAGWKSQLVAKLRGLVTIRRISGEAQSPAEAAVGAAERAMAGGDVGGAIDALSGLEGPAQAVAEPWLRTARQRLAVEAALRQVEAALTAAMAAPAPPSAGKG
ncbi:MAG: hypothetical protein JO032_02925 [Alphaproteobacteria bacterium]|nr:hypothetical protein [Alphaproteobacteria bacterium]